MKKDNSFRCDLDLWPRYLLLGSAWCLVMMIIYANLYWNPSIHLEVILLSWNLPQPFVVTLTFDPDILMLGPAYSLCMMITCDKLQPGQVEFQFGSMYKNIFASSKDSNLNITWPWAPVSCSICLSAIWKANKRIKIMENVCLQDTFHAYCSASRTADGKKMSHLVTMTTRICFPIKNRCLPNTARPPPPPPPNFQDWDESPKWGTHGQTKGKTTCLWWGVGGTELLEELRSQGSYLL